MPHLGESKYLWKVIDISSIKSEGKTCHLIHYWHSWPFLNSVQPTVKITADFERIEVSRTFWQIMVYSTKSFEWRNDAFLNNRHIYKLYNLSIILMSSWWWLSFRQWFLASRDTFYLTQERSRIFRSEIRKKYRI